MLKQVALLPNIMVQILRPLSAGCSRRFPGSKPATFHLSAPGPCATDRSSLILPPNSSSLIRPLIERNRSQTFIQILDMCTLKLRPIFAAMSVATCTGLTLRRQAMWISIKQLGLPQRHRIICPIMDNRACHSIIP